MGPPFPLLRQQFITVCDYVLVNSSNCFFSSSPLISLLLSHCHPCLPPLFPHQHHLLLSSMFQTAPLEQGVLAELLLGLNLVTKFIFVTRKYSVLWYEIRECCTCVPWTHKGCAYRYSGELLILKAADCPGMSKGKDWEPSTSICKS